MKLEPRHERLISYLSEHSPHKFGISELSVKLSLASKVLGNELPKLVENGYVSRHPVGRSYTYYVPKTPSKYLATATAANPYTSARALYNSLMDPIVKDDYKPVLTKLDWSMPYAVSHLFNAGITGDLSYQADAHKALVRFLEAVDATAQTCRMLLATVQLWDSRLPAWLTDGLSENQLEELGKFTRQALALHGRLDSSNQDPNLDDEDN